MLIFHDSTTKLICEYTHEQLLDNFKAQRELLLERLEEGSDGDVLAYVVRGLFRYGLEIENRGLSEFLNED